MMPRTRLLGTPLLPGWLGGAVAIQLRAGRCRFRVPFPIGFALLARAPVYLLDARARHLIPLAKKAAREIATDHSTATSTPSGRIVQDRGS